MEVIIHEVSEVSREVEVLAKSEELQPHFERAYKEYRPKIEIKGFRKGKAPLDLVKKLYGDMIENESLDTVASDLYRQVVIEKELKPIGEPVIVDMDYKRGEQFRFRVRYDIRPKIELKEYKGLQIEKPIHIVTEEEVQGELLRLRRVNSAMEEAQKVTDSEFVVTVEMQEVDDAGLPMIGKKNDDVRFYLADPQLEDPFKDALKSAETGGEYRVNFEHQHDDHAHKVNATLKVKKIERVVLPELNDEFAAKVTKDKISTIGEFQKSLKEDLVQYWDERSRRQVVNSIAGEIIRRHDFVVPDSLVRGVLNGLAEEIKNQYPDKRLPDDFDHEKFSQENRAYAIYQAKWALLREEIIRTENLTVDDKELTKLAEQEAPKIGIDKERLINYYKNSDQVKDRLIGDKLISFLMSNATIKEVEDKAPTL